MIRLPTLKELKDTSCQHLVEIKHLKPGDEFEIKLGRKQIRLVPAGSVDEE